MRAAAGPAALVLATLAWSVAPATVAPAGANADRPPALLVPARAHVGSEVAVRIVDRQSGRRSLARVCIEPPGGPKGCRRIALGPGRRERQITFDAVRPGDWLVTVSSGTHVEGRVVRVPPSGGRLSVLATGDSMVQRLDASLERRLRRRGASMSYDAHPATGISKPSLLDWVTQAQRAAATSPDVVVMFIGANDFFPMSGAACCGGGWVSQYARRARAMMAAYARGGRTRVLWLLLPTPREGFVRQSFPAVNAAIRRAASRQRRAVRVVDLPKLFSPGGRYRKWIRVKDREVGVRQADGIHLSDEGAAIAAKLIMRVLIEERTLPGAPLPRLMEIEEHRAG